MSSTVSQSESAAAKAIIRISTKSCSVPLLGWRGSSTFLKQHIKLTISTFSTVTFNLTGLTADLDLFILNACNPNNAIGISENQSNQNEQVILTLNPGTYTVVVDGFAGAASAYTLTAQCAPVTNGNCDPPAPNQLYAENVTKTTAQVVCTKQAIGYNWRYRVLGNITWWSVGSQGNRLTLMGLAPGTTYEYQCALRCINGSMGTYSDTKTFTTLADYGLINTCAAPAQIQCGAVYNGNTTAQHANSYTTYLIGNTVHGSMTGPEAAHRFTTSGNGSVTIQLNGFGADLDLFLLSFCDPAFGIAVSENQGNAPEQIVVNNLPAGTYYVLVDGYNGAASSYNLLVTCSNAGGNPQLYDNPCSAGTLTAGNTCSLQTATNTGATATTTPPAPADCNSSNMKDVWFRVQIPASGKVGIITEPGTLSNAVIAVYAGNACTALTYFGCIDDEPGGDQMPDLTISGVSGTWVWLRIWGFNGTTGTFSICAKSGSATNLRGSGGDPTGAGDRNDTEEAQVFSVSKVPALRIFPVPAFDFVQIVTEVSEDTPVELLVTDLSGRVVRTETTLTAASGTFQHRLDVRDLPNGSYVVRLKAGDQVQTGRFIKVSGE
jgi:hypothetical protein